MHARKVLIASLLALTANAGYADGWSVLPVKKADFKAEPTLAIMGGLLNPDVTGADSDSAYGVELSFNCIALQPPEGKLRTQISYTKYDDAGLEINSFEINPHYLWEVSKGLEVGVGPGLGFVSGKRGALDDDALALQFGASLHYRNGAMFLGAEARYQMTQEEFAGKDMDNSRLLLKAGYNF